MSLPTAEEMLSNAERELDKAHRALSDAADWLRSDWCPVGSSLTTEQAKRRTRMQKAITTGKAAIDNRKGTDRG